MRLLVLLFFLAPFSLAWALEGFESVPIETQNSDRNAPARIAKFQMTPNMGAKFYEVHIRPHKSIWKVPLVLKFPTTQQVIRLRLTPGFYYIKTRSLNNTEFPGPWSAQTSFKIDFKSSDFFVPRQGTLIEPRGSAKEIITFEWSAMPKAKSYVMIIKDAQGDFRHIIKTKNTWARVTLKTNSSYLWEVIPVENENSLHQNIHSISEQHMKAFQIQPPNLGGRRTLVQIKPDPKAYKYQFEVVSVDKTDNTSEPSIVESTTSDMSFKLVPGEYEIRARQVYPDESVSEWSAPGKFFVRRYYPQVIGPLSAQGPLDPDDEPAPILLHWQLDKDADSYQVYVWNEKNELAYQGTTTKSQLEVRLPPGTQYKWTVRALSTREPAQDNLTPAHANSTFKIEKYIRLDLISGEEHSQYYGWIRQITSNENYQGNNYDYNAIVRQNIFGGEQEGALGYWWRKTPLGVLGQVSLAGLNFRGQNYFYNNVGIHAGYRMLLSPETRLRFWLGMSYREIPEVLGHPFTSEVIYSKIKSWGPQFQVAYVRSINDTWGVQASGSLFHSQFDAGTPNGQKQLPQTSYWASLMSSYNYNPLLRFLAGYTYRVDQAAYESGDTPGAVNTSQITGHYLSLMLEFALEQKRK